MPPKKLLRFCPGTTGMQPQLIVLGTGIPKPSVAAPISFESEREINYEIIPPEFQCCITRELMTDPVYDKTQKGENIHYYERTAIAQWITLHHTNPFTRAVMTLEMLQGDPSLKKRIDAFKTGHASRLRFK